MKKSITFFNPRTEADLYVQTNYRILYEEDGFLIVDKPAPLPVHAVGRFKEKNLLSLLKKDLAPHAGEARIVNRLDSETSGLVMVAKSREAAGKLGALFENRRVAKEYRAVVFGVPSPRQGRISIRLGTAIRHSQRVRVPDPGGESAETDYEVLSDSGDYSLLKIIPYTGRTHQIRAHLAFLGHAIAGDKIYIDPRILEQYFREGWLEEMRAVVKFERLLLHAVRLSFPHPFTREPLTFVSELPECFMEMLK